MTDHIPKLYVCHETPDRSNPRATDRPAIRIDAPQGQEIAVITLTNYKVFGEDMSPEQWGAYIVKAVNNFQKLTDQITEYDTRLNEMQELNMELVEALEKCRKQFDLYVTNYMEKNPPDMDKAATNQEFVELCEAVLAKAGINTQAGTAKVLPA